MHRFYSLVIRVPDYKSRGPGSIPGATRFSEKYVWNGSTQPVKIIEDLFQGNSGSGLKNRN
jgi:hypothetical protein